MSSTDTTTTTTTTNTDMPAVPEWDEVVNVKITEKNTQENLPWFYGMIQEYNLETLVMSPRRELAVGATYKATVQRVDTSKYNDTGKIFIDCRYIANKKARQLGTK